MLSSSRMAWTSARAVPSSSIMTPAIGENGHVTDNVTNVQTAKWLPQHAASCCKVVHVTELNLNINLRPCIRSGHLCTTDEPQQQRNARLVLTHSQSTKPGRRYFVECGKLRVEG